MHARGFQLRAAHHAGDQTSARAHANGDIAGDALAPEIAGGGGHDGGVIGGVHHGVGRNGGVAAKEVRRHLNFGKSAPHTIAVDRRDARLQAGDQRLHGIGAADFGDGDRVKSATNMFFQQAQRARHLCAFGQFLDADGRRSDAACDANQRVIG